MRSAEDATEQLEDIVEMAARLRISDRSIRRLVSARRIPFYRVGGQLRFNPSEVLGALRSEAMPA